jgi:hypothetical protein
VAAGEYAEAPMCAPTSEGEIRGRQKDPSTSEEPLMFQPTTPEAVSAELQARREQIRAGFTRRIRRASTTPQGVARVPMQRSHPPTEASSRSRVRAA